MGDRLCPLLVVNLTGLVMLLMSDDPTMAGFGVALIVFAASLIIKDRIADELARRRG